MTTCSFRPEARCYTFKQQNRRVSNLLEKDLHQVKSQSRLVPPGLFPLLVS